MLAYNVSVGKDKFPMEDFKMIDVYATTNEGVSIIT